MEGGPMPDSFVSQFKTQQLGHPEGAYRWYRSLPY